MPESPTRVMHVGHHENHTRSCHALKVPAVDEAVSVISGSDLGARKSSVKSGDSDKSVEFCDSVGEMGLDGRWVGQGVSWRCECGVVELVENLPFFHLQMFIRP